MGKLTWKLGTGWQLVQSFHDEFWVNPEQPTLIKPIDATYYRSASVPAFTFGDLTHTSAASTVWNVRVGRFVYAYEDEPSSGDWTIQGRINNPAGVSSGAPPALGDLTLIRTTTKATVSQYRADVLGADHEWKLGTQLERGENHSGTVIPGGTRFVDVNGIRPRRSRVRRRTSAACSSARQHLPPTR